MKIQSTAAVLDRIRVARCRGAIRRRTTCRIILLLAVWTAFSASVAVAKDAGPAVRIPLAPLGYQAMLADFLLSGSSMMTVNFVDASHLLVTFSVRRLMKRDEVATPNDDDRTVGAFLLELPTGKVLAQTDWRLHDRGQYLWPLGHGRFLLRVKDQLTMIAPMSSSSAKEPFHEYTFLRVDRSILAILLSADDDLLTIETVDRPASSVKDSAQVHFGPQTPDQTPSVQINFYRLADEGPDKLQVASAGVLRSRAALALPLTTSGYIEVLEGGRDRWLMNFDSHAGKVTEMPEFPTTCYPRATFVSRSEFVAFGCRGSTDRQNIGGFNVKGEEMWQQNFFDSQLAPGFSFAPAAGRFAMERTIVGGTLAGRSPALAADVTAQEVRVYQTYDGKLLLRTDCTPAVRAGQNFALSPDGMQLAVIRESIVQHGASKYDEAHTSKSGAVEIYALPPLTGKDQAAVKDSEAMVPADLGTRVDLVLQRGAARAPEKVSSKAPASAGPQGADMSQEVHQSAEPASAGDAQPASGDPEPTAPRKPPTLYGPGETPGTKQR